MQSFTEESSPENLTGSTTPLGMGRVRSHSTESLDSLSDESAGHSHNKTSSSTSSRKVIRFLVFGHLDCWKYKNIIIMEARIESKVNAFNF